MTKKPKFSPHLFKIEPVTTDEKAYSPNGGVELAVGQLTYKGDHEDDDIIEIDGL